jgi:hypothetical protein
MRGLVRVGAERAALGGRVPSALDASDFGERLAARFARVSGVTPALPPRPRMAVLPFAATDHRPPEAP